MWSPSRSCYGEFVDIVDLGMMRDADKQVEITGWMTGGVMEISSAEAICQATEN